MGTLAVFAGLDYHDEAVQVCVMNARGEQLCNRSVGNSALAVRRLVARHGTRVQAAIESCPGAANLAEELVQRAFIEALARVAPVTAG